VKPEPLAADASAPGAVGPGEPAQRDAAHADMESESAVRMLTDRLADAIRAQIVEADDRHTLRLLELVEELLRENNDAPPPDQSSRVVWLQRAMRTYRALLERAPDRLSALREQLEAFDGELDRAGLAAVQLSLEYSLAVVARFAMREGLTLLLGAPLALCGIVAHVIPYQITAAAVRLIPHTDEEEATDKIAAGLVFFPLAWAAEAYAVFVTGGRWAVIVFLVMLPPTGFFALAWRERFERVGREARALVRFLRDRDLPRRLRQRRHELATDLAALAGFANE
jgi:glycerol-3-phosphate O-acyltransferase / dihydroxyacetone phosphate acyltransferase